MLLNDQLTKIIIQWDFSFDFDVTYDVGCIDYQIFLGKSIKKIEERLIKLLIRFKDDIV